MSIASFFFFENLIFKLNSQLLTFNSPILISKKFIIFKCLYYASFEYVSYKCNSVTIQWIFFGQNFGHFFDRSFVYSPSRQYFQLSLACLIQNHNVIIPDIHFFHIICRLYNWGIFLNFQLSIN